MKKFICLFLLISLCFSAYPMTDITLQEYNTQEVIIEKLNNIVDLLSQLLSRVENIEQKVAEIQHQTR